VNKGLKKIWDLLTTALVIVAVVFALLLVGARVAGYKVYAVLSGSMEPTYHTGALIYVKTVDTSEIKEGQVITFMLSEDTIATHRVIEVIQDENEPGTVRFRTKGDANNAPDGSLVHYKNVIGTPVFTIPYLGYVASYIQHPPGTYYAIAAVAIIILMAFLPDLIKDDDEEKQKVEKEANVFKKGEEQR
jgi:signal peptidase